MKLSEALFKEPWQAYQVLSECWATDSDDFSEWDLRPLSGKTLAEEDVDGPFQGLFIIAGKMVSNKTDSQSCYLDLTLPERIAGHHFVQIAGRLERRRGLRAADGRVIPAIGIEKLGDYTLFLAKENPSAGINVLKGGIPNAHHRDYLAYDLALLLRDQRRYEEAIDAFSIVLAESHSAEISPILHMLYRERARLYAAIGQSEKAVEDENHFAALFEKKYGHAPGPHEV